MRIHNHQQHLATPARGALLIVVAALFLSACGSAMARSSGESADLSRPSIAESNAEARLDPDGPASPIVEREGAALPRGAVDVLTGLVESIGRGDSDDERSSPTIGVCQCTLDDPAFGAGWALTQISAWTSAGAAAVARATLAAPDGGAASVLAVLFREEGDAWSIDALHRAGTFDDVSERTASTHSQRLERAAAALSTGTATSQASLLSSVRSVDVQADDGVSVEPDPVAGAIVAEGSVLLPPTFDGDDEVKSSASDCPECRWRLRIACSVPDALCGGAFLGCPVGATRWLVELLRPPATDYVVVGTICRFPADELLAPGELGERVAERFVELLPRSSPRFQPASGGLVNLPTLFAAGEPERIGPVAATVVGYSVQISATASWRWDFGDGVVLVTDEPGGSYPVDTVQHTFLRPGTREVDVTTRWLGEFTVNGDGPYVVPGGPIALTSTVEVPVREAGARLLSP